jgi:hypothetical protein
MKTSYKKVTAYLNAQPPGSNRAKAYEISKCVVRAGENGIAFEIANDHRTDYEILRAMNHCLEIGIAEKKDQAYIFEDGSMWEKDGCTAPDNQQENRSCA